MNTEKFNLQTAIQQILLGKHTQPGELTAVFPSFKIDKAARVGVFSRRRDQFRASTDLKKITVGSVNNYRVFDETGMEI